MVRWTHTSKLDLMQIFRYIAKDSVYYAKKVANNIIDKADYLADFPNMGRKIEEIDDDNLREIIVYSYRVIYRVDEDDVNILTIVHCKRDLIDGILEERL